MIRLAALLLVFTASMFTGVATVDARKAALVIGINAYDEIDDLDKAVGDAVAMGAKLRSLGFDVTELHDPNRRSLNQAISTFTATLAAGDTALVHFSGHGVEIDGENYLLPSDIPTPQSGQQDFVKTEAIAMSQLIARVADGGARTRLFVIDACRNNPFAQKGVRAVGGTRGLSRVDAPAGTFIMYSAGYRQTALDRLGPGDPETTSVYTRTLLNHLGKPGRSIADIARDVRSEVEKLARSIGHDQRPAYYDELSARLVLVPGGDSGDDAARVQPSVAPQQDNRLAEAAAAWGVIEKSTSVAVIAAFRDRFAGTVFSDLAEARLRELEATQAPKPQGEPKVAAVAPQPEPSAQTGSGSTTSDIVPTRLARDIKWQVPSSYPTGMAVVGTLPTEFAEELDRVTSGKFVVEIMPPNSLAPVFDTFEMVGKGELDAVWSTSYYWAHKDPAFHLISGAVPFGRGPWDLLSWFNNADGGEFRLQTFARHNIHALACGISGAEGAGWFKKPLQSARDITDLKVRAAGLASTVMTAAGAKIVLLPGAEIYRALEIGVIDAAEFSLPAIDEFLGFADIAKTYYHPGWHVPATVYDLMINRDVWQGLSVEARAALERACGENFYRSLQAFEADEAGALDRIRAKGVTVTQMPKDVLAALKAAADRELDSLAASNPFFAEALQSYRNDAWVGARLIAE